jgi:GMP synthase (glutamine-hydrolysing)
VLGICYGAQLTAKQFGGKVERSSKREYGRAILHPQQQEDALLKGLMPASQVWMSHGDSILELPSGFEVLATTDNIPVAAFRMTAQNSEAANGTTTPNSKLQTPNPLYGLQFHPEVYHSIEGKKILRNFLVNICGCTQDWTPAHFVTDTIDGLKKQIGEQKVVMAISGGVDSTVAATLISRAIGDNLHCIFVDNGVLRKDEFESVLATYKTLGLNVKASMQKRFLQKAERQNRPGKKRKAIGKLFIDIFQEEAKKIKGVSFLGQGTIYPDVIESVSVHGPSVTIKSHHNVGGLPKKMHLKLVEPLRSLFKDEVRKVGLELGIPQELISRHPFPGRDWLSASGRGNRRKSRSFTACRRHYVKALKTHNLYARFGRPAPSYCRCAAWV